MWADEDEYEEPGNRKRLAGRIALALAAIGGLGTAIYFFAAHMPGPGRHTVQTVTRIVLPPPPPPPPPPPKQPEPEKVVETPKLQEPKAAEKKPDKAPPKPRQPPATPLTAEAGTGANPYGLTPGNGSGNTIGGGGGDGTATYQSYGRVVSGGVQAALRGDDKLRFARFATELRIWLDSTGKVTRVQLAGSSGDPAIDTAVTRAIGGLAIGEAPPKDMPQPIRLRTKSEPG